MQYLLDTNILIDMADGVATTLDRVASLPLAVAGIAAVSAAELEASIVADPQWRAEREHNMRPLLDLITIVPFEADTAQRYGEIVARCGYNRRKAVDRFIAATALCHDLTLVTRNPADFREIEGLAIEDWSG